MKKLTFVTILLLLCICAMFLCGCSTIWFYDDPNDKGTGVFREDFSGLDKGYQIQHPHQESLVLWSNFECSLFISHPEDEIFQIVRASYDIYKLNGQLIVPIDEWIGDNKDAIRKWYKYSIFFPSKVREVIEVKFYYNGEYYEYSHEAIITKRRNVSWWSQWMGI